MKNRIKKFLRKIGLYNYLKFSPLFYLYEKVCKPGVERQKNKEINFYRSFLPDCHLIFDIGAYDGHKAAAFLHLAKKVVCCEADATNFKILKVRFRGKKDRVYLEKLAIGANEGEAQMYLHHKGSAFNTVNEKFKNIAEHDELERWNEKIQYQEKVQVKMTTLNSLIQKHGHPFFIKIDVEGYEMQVIKGLSRTVPFISIECLLPDFFEELQQTFLLLLRLDPQASFNIAVEEQLIFSQFQPYSETAEYLKKFEQRHFELIIKMKE